MKIYKIKHKPTGMFFKPSKYPSHHNLSKTGKVYHKRITPFSLMKTYLGEGKYGMTYNHPIKDYPYYERRTTCINDWEILEGEI
jgi:hypothetical protein